MEKIYEDFSGRRIGKLVVIGPTKFRGGVPVRWLCQCDCGNKVNVVGSKLRDEALKSCGCQRKVKADLAGQKIGYLLVIKPTEQRINGNIVWECLCDCGNTAYKTSNQLLSGHTKSCGCYYKEQLKQFSQSITGQRFGKLVVVKYVTGPDGKTLWECKCDCGNTTYVTISNLRSGNTKSCGCLPVGRKPYGKKTRSVAAASLHSPSLSA